MLLLHKLRLVDDLVAGSLEVDGRIEDEKPHSIKERIDALASPLEKRKKALDASKDLHQLLRYVIFEFLF